MSLKVHGGQIHGAPVRGLCQIGGGLQAVKGERHTNVLLYKVAKTFPYSPKAWENHVSIGQNRYKGNRLNYYWIFPNPDSPGLYLANIGYNDPGFIDLGHEGENYGDRFKDVSDYGWYDYKVWDFKQPVAMTKGYFDFYWKTTLAE